MGKRNKKNHVRCRRCGNNSFNPNKRYCSKCGFGRTKKIREYSWANKKVLTGVRIK